LTSSVLVIPPHTDMTLSVVRQPGWMLYDMNRAFALRVLQPRHIDREMDALEQQTSVSHKETLQSVLLGRSAAMLLTCSSSFHSYFHAARAALISLSAGSATPLTLDDLEIVEGTTENPDDVCRAADNTMLFEQEVAEAIDVCQDASSVRIWLEHDKQLPVALALANRLDRRIRLELAGPFTQAHRHVLTQRPLFDRAFCVDSNAIQWLHVGLPSRPSYGENLAWRAQSTDAQPRGALPWAGYAPLSALLDPERLIASQCRVVVVGFCAIGENIRSYDGKLLTRSAIQQGTARLRRAGIRVIAEWWIGAPGVSAPHLYQTLEEIQRGSFFDWLSGFRLFQWPIKKLGGRWGDVTVHVNARSAEHSLARSCPFSAPATLEPAEAYAMLTRLRQQLSFNHFPPSPGRIAGAYVHTPKTIGPRGPGICLDPDCTIVRLSLSPSGTSGPAWFAVNLRVGTITAVDSRLAPILAEMRNPAPPIAALATIPEGQRARTFQALVKKQILVELPT